MTENKLENVPFDHGRYEPESSQVLDVNALSDTFRRVSADHVQAKSHDTTRNLVFQHSTTAMPVQLPPQPPGLDVDLPPHPNDPPTIDDIVLAQEYQRRVEFSGRGKLSTHLQ